MKQWLANLSRWHRIQASVVLGLFLAGVSAGCHEDGARPGLKHDATSQRSGASGASKPRYLESSLQAVKANSLHQKDFGGKSERAWFVDGTSESGVTFRYQSGRDGNQFTILETVGGGVAMLDFDADGDLDLMFPGGGRIGPGTPLVISGSPIALFENNGKGHFTDVSHLVEGPAISFYSHGAFASDYDRDGDVDVFVTGFRSCCLLRNEGGKRFSDATKAAGLRVADWATAAAWADLNRDGWPDIFSVSYLDWDALPDPNCGNLGAGVRDTCPPNAYPPARQRVFLNQKGGSFQEQTHALQGTGPEMVPLGKGMGVVATDLNGDGWMDFYVGNDVMDNHLYLGSADFPLQEVGVASFTAGNEFGVAEGSMGVDAGDYDGDGLADLIAANFQLEDNSLYKNQGHNLFAHATVQAGLAGVSRPEVKFGTGFADFDLDGWLDLFLISGHVAYVTGQSPYLQSPFLLHNEPQGLTRRFRDVSREFGGPWFAGKYAGRGAAVGDLDNDGDLDLVVVQQDGPVSVLFNQLQSLEHYAGHRPWIRLDVRGTVSEPGAVGAVVSYPFEGRILTRHIRSGAGYLSHFDSRILLPVEPASQASELEGVNAAQALKKKDSLHVVVRWLTGAQEIFRNLKPMETNIIEEGHGEPQ